MADGSEGEGKKEGGPLRLGTKELPGLSDTYTLLLRLHSPPNVSHSPS